MDKMVVTKSDLYPNDTMGMENKTVIVTTILVIKDMILRGPDVPKKNVIV